MRNILIVLAILVLLGLFIPAFTKMNDLKKTNLEYEKQILQLQTANAELKEELERLETDPMYLEKVGREKMGLVKDGEVIYKIEEAEEQ